MFPFRRRPIDPRTGLPAPPIDHEVDLDADDEADAADEEPPPPTPQLSPPRLQPDAVETPTTGELQPYLPVHPPDASLTWPPSPALPVVVPDSPLPLLDEVVLDLLGAVQLLFRPLLVRKPPTLTACRPPLPERRHDSTNDAQACDVIMT